MRSTLAFACSLLAGTALAQEAPDGAALSEALAADIPPYWEVLSVDVTATVNDGDAVEPAYRQRFVATVSPRGDLYQMMQMPGETPFGIVVETVDDEATRQLFGVARSSLSLGQLQTSVEIENPLGALGQPRDLFPVPTLVAGSEEADAKIADIAAGRQLSVAAMEAATRADARSAALEELIAEQTRLVEMEGASTLAAIRERFAREREAVEADGAARIAALEASLETERNRVQTALDAQSTLADTVESETDAMLTAFRERLAKQREAIERSGAERLEALRAETDAAIAAVEAEAETRQAVAETEAEVAAKRALADARKELEAATVAANEADTAARRADLASRAGEYEVLRDGLASTDVQIRNAAFDRAMETGDTQLTDAAIDLAMKSGDDGLQAKALRQMAQTVNTFGINLENGKESYVHSFVVNTKSKDGLAFQGTYYNSGNNYRGNRGSNRASISRDTITLEGYCKTVARADDNGVLRGTTSCGGDKNYNAVVSF